MSEEHAGQVAAAKAIPRTHVLGYLTNEAVTATRVRRVTATAMLWIATAFLLVAIQGAWEFVQTEGTDFWDLYSDGDLDVSHFDWWIRSEFRTYMGWHWVFMMVGPPSVILLSCSGAVRKGRSGICSFCSVLMLPLLFAAGWAAAVSAALSLYMGTGIYTRPVSRLYLLGLLGTVGAVVVTLLLWDVRNYLRWIARNPLEEKPRVPFLPKAG